MKRAELTATALARRSHLADAGEADIVLGPLTTSEGQFENI